MQEAKETKTLTPQNELNTYANGYSQTAFLQCKDPFACHSQTASKLAYQHPETTSITPTYPKMSRNEIFKRVGLMTFGPGNMGRSATVGPKAYLYNNASEATTEIRAGCHGSGDALKHLTSCELGLTKWANSSSTMSSATTRASISSYPRQTIGPVKSFPATTSCSLFQRRCLAWRSAQGAARQQRTLIHSRLSCV